MLVTAQRFTPLGCLHIHLLNDCPFLHWEGHFLHHVRLRTLTSIMCPLTFVTPYLG